MKQIDDLYEVAEQFLRFQVKAGGYPCHASAALRCIEGLTKILRADEWTDPDRIAHAVSLPTWIPTTECLPDEGTPVLIYRPGHQCRQVAVAWLNDGTWRDGMSPLARSVTHWMPLPEPPEER